MSLYERFECPSYVGVAGCSPEWVIGMPNKILAGIRNARNAESCLVCKVQNAESPAAKSFLFRTAVCRLYSIEVSTYAYKVSVNAMTPK